MIDLIFRTMHGLSKAQTTPKKGKKSASRSSANKPAAEPTNSSTAGIEEDSTSINFSFEGSDIVITETSSNSDVTKGASSHTLQGHSVVGLQVNQRTEVEDFSEVTIEEVAVTETQSQSMVVPVSQQPTNGRSLLIPSINGVQATSSSDVPLEHSQGAYSGPEHSQRAYSGPNSKHLSLTSVAKTHL